MVQRQVHLQYSRVKRFKSDETCGSEYEGMVERKMVLVLELVFTLIICVSGSLELLPYHFCISEVGHLFPLCPFVPDAQCLCLH